MKSILSIPIHDSDSTLIGVLSLDSDQFYTTSRFNDVEVQRILRLHAKVVGRIIEYAEFLNINSSLEV
jgi:hypothetical protein